MYIYIYTYVCRCRRGTDGRRSPTSRIGGIGN